jgi:hypothetical protein
VPKIYNMWIHNCDHVKLSTDHFNWAKRGTTSARKFEKLKFPFWIHWLHIINYRQSSSSSRQNLFTLRTTVCKALLLLLERASDSPCMIAIFISCMITLARSESFFHCWNNSFSMLESDVRTCRRTWCTQN